MNIIVIIFHRFGSKNLTGLRVPIEDIGHLAYGILCIIFIYNILVALRYELSLPKSTSRNHTFIFFIFHMMTERTRTLFLLRTLLYFDMPATYTDLQMWLLTACRQLVWEVWSRTRWSWAGPTAGVTRKTSARGTCSCTRCARSPRPAWPCSCPKESTSFQTLPKRYYISILTSPFIYFTFILYEIF